MSLMLSYEKQLDLKRQTVVEAYKNYSNIPSGLIPPIGDTIGSPLQYGYRTKLTPHFQRPPFSFQKAQKRGDAPAVEGKPEWLKIGFHVECPIATPVINKGLVPVRQNVIDNITKYKNGATLLLRDSLRPESSGDTDIPATTSIAAEDGEHVCVTDQKATVRERVGDMLFEYTAGTFFQNNNSALVPLTSYARDAIFPPDATATGEKPTHLVDAYCGSGLFSIMLAPHFTRVAGIELSAESIRAAERNAALNALPASQISFMAGDAANIFDTVQDFPRARTALVIDPPRKGTDERFIDQMLAFGAGTVVYVSCNVHTQARDVGMILRKSEERAKEGGGKKYVLESLRGLDLFPQTAHVEAIAVLRLGNVHVVVYLGGALLGSEVPEFLPNLDLLARSDVELEVVRRLEYEHDRAPETEAAHLVALRERLAIEEGRRTRVDSFGVGAHGMLAAGTDVGAQCLGRDQSSRGAIGGTATYLVKVDLDTADVGRAHGDHAEEAVSPTAEQRDAFVQDEQVRQALRHPGRDREQVACKTRTSDWRPQRARSSRALTDKVPSTLHNPGRGAVEAVVVAGREVDDHEERVVPVLCPHAREAVPPDRRRAYAHFGRHPHVLRDRLGQRLVARHRRVHLLPVLPGGRGRAEELVEAVLDPVDLRKVLVVHFLHLLVGELDGGRGGAAGAGDAEERVEGVGAAFDLFDFAVLDDAKVQHATLAVEELAERTVLGEVWRVDLVEVAAEDPRVEAEAVWAKPDRQLEGVEVSP
ncbi:hypothetical protein ACG7TL_001003 [Trametes sanguinea]